MKTSVVIAVVLLSVLVIFLEIRPGSAMKCFQCAASTCGESKQYWAQQKCKGKKYCVKEYGPDGKVIRRSCAKDDPEKEGCVNEGANKKCFCGDDLCNAEDE